MPVLSSKNIEEIEGSLGYQFSNKKILIKSLTHKSYFHEHPNNADAYNERLEFLGDSILGAVIAEAFFLDKRLFSEADMSKMKSYLVNESVLFEIATQLSLGKYLRLGKGEESTGGRQKRSILSDAVEALLGAVFIDSGYETTKSVILGLFEDRLENVILSKEGHDFKSELQEKCQGIFGVLPDYRIVKQEGEEHRKVFTSEVYIKNELYGSGAGKSKKEAQMAAAKEALERLLAK